MPEVKTGSLTWTISEIRDACRPSAELAPSLLEGNPPFLELPRFQREPVWSKSKQQSLIRSIRAGWPIGALLVYDKGTEENRNVFLLVDGMQRVTALRDYLKSPLTFMDASDVPDPLLAGLLANLADATDVGLQLEPLRRGLETWMGQTTGFKLSDGFNSEALLSCLTDVPDVSANTEAKNALNAFLDELKEHVGIENVLVPAIVYRGSQNDLPEIFQRANQGTALDRYQILAATWTHQETTISTEEVRQAVVTRYSTLIEAGYTINGVPDNLDLPDFSLYEYLFGLGKVLRASFPLLFGPSESAVEADPHGFNLAATIHGLRRSSQMAELSNVFHRTADGTIDPASFESALFEGCGFVWNTLKPFIGLRLNEQGNTTLVAHSEYQIESMIARAVVARWDHGTQELREGWEEERTTLHKTLPQHYLYDLLVQAWRGTGDKTMFERTWHRDEPTDPLSPANHYLQAITFTNMDLVLRSWFEQQLTRVQKKRPSVRSVDKAFLKFIYASIVTYAEDQGVNFELDHLYPVARLVNLIGEEEAGWPISCISNLALFHWKINRDSRTMTVQEYLNSLGGDDLDWAKKQVERYLLCDVASVDLPSEGGKDLLTLNQYQDFLRARFSVMTKHVLEAVGIPIPALEPDGP